MNEQIETLLQTVIDKMLRLDTLFSHEADLSSELADMQIAIGRTQHLCQQAEKDLRTAQHALHDALYQIAVNFDDNEIGD